MIDAVKDTPAINLIAKTRFNFDLTDDSDVSGILLRITPEGAAKLFEMKTAVDEFKSGTRADLFYSTRFFLPEGVFAAAVNTLFEDGEAEEFTGGAEVVPVRLSGGGAESDNGRGEDVFAGGNLSSERADSYLFPDYISESDFFSLADTYACEYDTSGFTVEFSDAGISFGTSYEYAAGEAETEFFNFENLAALAEASFLTKQTAAEFAPQQANSEIF